MKDFEELRLELEDREWPLEAIDHDRIIARAVVTDGKGMFYFIKGFRDDEFGKTAWIETSGGGADPGESLEDAVRRELKEEMGAQVDIICKIGIVSDYYNLIRRHNINNYYLCLAGSFGERNLTLYEQQELNFSVVKMTLEQAIKEYRCFEGERFGRLVSAREIPVLEKVAELLASGHEFPSI